MRMNNDLILRKAKIADIKIIHQLLFKASEDGLLLPRPLINLYNHVREFFVFEDKNNAEIVGCSALSIVWEDIAEVRSLIVRKDLRRQGLGAKLLEVCIAEAVEFGLYKIFTLTYQEDFFTRSGFKVVKKDVLPNKVWADCINCAKFPDCDEIAMLLELK
jgi:amino-acid N-acetyltransferase